MKRQSAIVIIALWLAMLVANAHAQPASAAASDSAAAAPVPGGDDEARCFQAVLDRSGDTVWCDVLISRLNAQLPMDTLTETTLARVYHNRAVLLLNGDELELAEADLMAAMRLRPQLPELQLTLGNLRLYQRRFSEALDYFNEAIVLSNGLQPEYFISRALALRGLGQIELAADDVRRYRGEPVPVRDSVSPSGSDAVPGDGFQ